MKSTYGKGHMIDIIFTLALFCVFAASALLVVLIGANVYKSASGSMNENFSTRTCLTYISTKIRQNDDSGGIYLTNLDGCDALVLEQEIDGEAYLTWIYHYNGELRELFSLKDSGAGAEDGLVIMSVPSLLMERADNGLLRFTSVDDGGRRTSLSVAPRCREAAL